MLDSVNKTIEICTDFNLWDIVLISLEEVAKKSDQVWGFKYAIELQWKQLKNDMCIIEGTDDQNAHDSINPHEQDSDLQDALNATSENPYLFDYSEPGKMQLITNCWFERF